MQKRLLLIDTFDFLHRAYYALPRSLTTKDGQVVNAVYGFSSMLLSTIFELKPTHIAAAFESKEEPTFREVEYAEYKATRAEKPSDEQEEFDSQIPIVEKVLDAFGIACVEIPGYEADDVIGTLAKKVVGGKGEVRSGKIDEVIIITNDQDMLQLVGDGVKVYVPAKGKREAVMFDEARVLEKYGFTPLQMVDYKALRGDPSDNIPGVKGIGEKIARDLLSKYKTIEDIYEHIEEIEPASVRQKLEQDRESVVFSKRLATIATDADYKFDLEDFKFDLEGSLSAVRRMFKELSFVSLIKRIERGSGKEPQESQLSLF